MNLLNKIRDKIRDIYWKRSDKLYSIIANNKWEFDSETNYGNNLATQRKRTQYNSFNSKYNITIIRYDDNVVMVRGAHIYIYNKSKSKILDPSNIGVLFNISKINHLLSKQNIFCSKEQITALNRRNKLLKV